MCIKKYIYIIYIYYIYKLYIYIIYIYMYILYIHLSGAGRVVELEKRDFSSSLMALKSNYLLL